MTHVSSLNIRVSHQIKGCGEAVFPWLWEYGLPCHTLIVSPPGGETTLLRDFIRLFSDGFGDYPGMSVSLIDERSEVGASYMGMPQNDLGMRTIFWTDVRKRRDPDDGPVDGTAGGRIR